MPNEHLTVFIDNSDFIGRLDNWFIYVSYKSKYFPIRATDGFGKMMKAKSVPEIEEKIKALR